MKRYSLIPVLILSLFLCSCSILVDTNTPKSAELTEKYDFYEKSVANIRSICHVTPEEADEIFLVLVNDCNVSELINYVSKNSDGTFSMWSSGQNYTVTLEDNVVSTVSTMEFLTKVQLYPADVTESPAASANAPVSTEPQENASISITEEPSTNLESDATTSTSGSEKTDSVVESGGISALPDVSNVLSILPIHTTPVMNGFGTSVIGTRAYVEITKEELKTVTNEQYTQFVDTTVKDSGYNWFTIFCDDDTGICFAGSIGYFAEYGILDSEGSITEVIGYITISEDGYIYEPAE